MSCSGRSWGVADVESSTLTFQVDKKPAFRVPLRDVGQVQQVGKSRIQSSHESHAMRLQHKFSSMWLLSHPVFETVAFCGMWPDSRQCKSWKFGLGKVNIQTLPQNSLESCNTLGSWPSLTTLLHSLCSNEWLHCWMGWSANISVRAPLVWVLRAVCNAGQRWNCTGFCHRWHNWWRPWGCFGGDIVPCA